MPIQIHEIIARSAAERGDAPALAFKGDTLSYAVLWERVAAFASALARLGVQRGDRVAIYLDKRIETVVAIFGVSAAGGVFVPVNPLLRPGQVGHILDDCDVRVLVTAGDRAGLLGEELERRRSVKWAIAVGDLPDSAPRLRCETVAWDDLAPGEGAPSHPAVDSDIAAIFYTSGSTGKPKGVVLSHRNLVVGAESVTSYLGNHADDRILSVLPLSFDAGFSQLTTGFAVGAQVILVNYLLPRDIVRLCAEHRVTGLTCVPPLWIQLAAQSWPPEATGHLRYFANTGGRMPRVTLDKLRETFPAARPYLMYGLTEAFRSTYLDPAEIDRRPDSIGKAIPNAEVLVVREDGTPCNTGEEGELVHRGPLVALGYWNDPERTAERFRPPPGREAAVCAPEVAVWSGDAVVRDEEGFLYFVSRKDEMIKTSGYRVSPTEVEEVAYATGLVEDAVALGLEDDQLGQRIALVASANGRRELDAEALLAELRQRLPRYMVPAQVVARAGLPRSPNGKLDRNRIREEVEAS